MILGLHRERQLLYLALLLAFIGGAFLSIDLGAFALFPFRLILAPLVLILVSRLLFVPGGLRLRTVTVGGLLLFLMLWFIYALASSLWAFSKLDSVRHLVFLFSGIVTVFAIVYYLTDADSLMRLYWLWILIYTGFVIIGVWEIVTGNHLSVSGYADTGDDRYRFLPSAVFHNTNDLATFIALSIPLVIVGIRDRQGLWWKLAGIILLTGGLLVLLQTGSRANYIAVVLSVAFWLFFLQKGRSRLTVLLIVGAVLLAVSWFVPTQLHKTSELIALQLSSLDQTFATDSIRLNLVLRALRGVLDSGGIGVGAGNAEYYISQFTYETNHITNVHNWWIEILLDYGLWIFVGYVLFYLTILWNLYIVWRSSLNLYQRMLAAGLLAGLIGFAVGSVSSSTLAAFMPQWIYFGFAIALINSYRLLKRSKSLSCTS